MVYDLLTGFEEFKNSSESRKHAEAGSDNRKLLEFRKVKRGKVIAVDIKLNKSLINELKTNKVFTFKLLFNEQDRRVAIKYDNSTNAMSMVNKRTKQDGSLVFNDKYVRYTMLPLLENTKKLVYECKTSKDGLIYIFKKVK